MQGQITWPCDEDIPGIPACLFPHQLWSLCGGLSQVPGCSDVVVLRYRKLLLESSTHFLAYSANLTAALRELSSDSKTMSQTQGSLISARISSIFRIRSSIRSVRCAYLRDIPSRFASAATSSRDLTPETHVLVPRSGRCVVRTPGPNPGGSTPHGHTCVSRRLNSKNPDVP